MPPRTSRRLQSCDFRSASSHRTVTSHAPDESSGQRSSSRKQPSIPPWRERRSRRSDEGTDIHVLVENEDVVCSLKEPQESEDWERLDIGIDSCATTSCMPKDKLTEWPLMTASGAQSYTTASGQTTEVLGRRQLQAWFQNGTENMVNVKVLDPLHKALFAVSELIRTCKVVFDLEEHGGSYLEHRKTKSQIKVYLRRGVFVMPVWFKRRPSTKMKERQSKMDLSGVSEIGAHPDPFRGQAYQP